MRVREAISVAGGKAVLSVRADGIMHLIWAPGSYIDEKDALSAVTVMNQICAGRGKPLLVDMRNAGNTSSGARDVFAMPHAASRVALLGESPVDEVIAIFFTRSHQPPRPTRYFTSEAEAVSWLSGG
ncbi:MAG: STAS/SEC14 domain-containing protein [Pseudarthrobacter sp.]|nr:STAS/SEC14 domain-containing protein [Pseudarthrobacter sp.]